MKKLKQALCLSVFLIAGFSVLSTWSEAQKTSLEVGVPQVLVRPNDLAVQSLPKGEVTLGQKTVATTKNTNLAELLKSQGIYPDSNSLKVAQQMNPGGLSSSNLPKGHRLQIPAIHGGSMWGQAKRTGFLVPITVGQFQTYRLNSNISSVRTASNRISRIDLQRFEAPQDKKVLVSYMQTAQISLQTIATFQSNARDQTLQVVNQEATLLSSLATKQDRIDRNLMGIAEAASHDLLMRSEDIKAGTDKPIRVEVVIYDKVRQKNKERQKVYGYRPYWMSYSVYLDWLDDKAPIGKLKSLSYAFSGVTTPRHGALHDFGVARYVIWSPKPGDDTRTPVTEMIDVHVRQDMIPPELTIIK